jgi:flagellar protein FliO/FliZ
MRYGLTTLLLSAAPVLQAQETAVPALGNAPELLSAGYLMQVVGSLAIVFGAVVLMAVIVKRVNRSPSTGKASLSVMGSTNVGTREKVVLINAAGQQILVGVAPGNVRTLHVFDESLATEIADEAKPADFSAVWQSVNPFGGSR